MFIKVLFVLLAISLVLNFIGLVIFYKYTLAKANLQSAINQIKQLNDLLEQHYQKRMVFLHHSVGAGILYDGGLADSLRRIGVLVKSATYGDEIGQHTDICDWTTKFTSSMDLILRFKAHPNTYYSDGTTNDVVMFKSCFPNSDIVEDGTEPGDATSKRRSVANYRAVFESLANQFARYPDKLFIYLTAPPLVPQATTPDNARRAKDFNRWLVQAFLPKYRNESGLDNFVVFDLFSLIADESGHLKEEFRVRQPGDSHPNSSANRYVAARFMEFFLPLWQSWTECHLASK